jgi:hypothetical protein
LLPVDQLVQLVSDFATNDRTTGAIPVYLYIEDSTSMRYFEHGPKGIRPVLSSAYQKMATQDQTGRPEAPAIFWAEFVQRRLIWEPTADLEGVQTYDEYAKEHKLASLKEFLTKGLTLGAQCLAC